MVEETRAKSINKTKILYHKKAMQSTDADEWSDVIKNEKARFDKCNALTPIPWSSLPKWSKVLTTIQATKNKSYRAHLEGLKPGM